MSNVIREIFVEDHVQQVSTETLGSLSMQRFWATDGHRKCTVFLFYLSWHYHIYFFKSLCASRDDYFENLGETNVLACKMFTSGCRPWLKNVACLSSLLRDLNLLRHVLDFKFCMSQAQWRVKIFVFFKKCFVLSASFFFVFPREQSI